MKKTFLLILSNPTLDFCLDCKRDGNWVWFWESAFRATEGQFKDDKQIGVWTYYYENGDFSYQDNFDIISK